MTYQSAVLHTEEMEKVVNLFLDLLIKKRPELAAQINRDRKELVNQMITILSEHPNTSKKSLADTDFVKALTSSFVTAVSIHIMGADPKLKPQDKIYDLLLKNGIDLSDPKFNPLDPKFDLKALNKQLATLNPAVQKAIQNELAVFMNQIKLDHVKAELLPPRPTPTPKGAEPEAGPDIGKETTKDIALENVFGINPKFPGGKVRVVQYVGGNGLGFPDQNPYPGLAPIDRQNDVNDNAVTGGDYLGINALTIGNMLEYSSPFVAEFKEELGNRGLSIGGPKLTPR